jgi:hypothetical protein
MTSHAKWNFQTTSKSEKYSIVETALLCKICHCMHNGRTIWAALAALKRISIKKTYTFANCPTPILQNFFNLRGQKSWRLKSRISSRIRSRIQPFQILVSTIPVRIFLNKKKTIENSNFVALACKVARTGEVRVVAEDDHRWSCKTILLPVRPAIMRLDYRLE